MLFGSELGALKAHPAFQAQISRDALALLMRHNYVPAPYCIYEGFYKLVPGTIWSVGVKPISAGDGTAVPYWRVRNVVEQGLANPFTGSEYDAVSCLEARLREIVTGQMIADVPLGAFLSGGIDSSLVVALMQAQGSRPVKTFTIGFREATYNEAKNAMAVARHIGSEHTELYVTPKDAIDVIPLLPQLYEEPFSDSSQIPTFLVARLARQHVTVSLSGDGGDEVFGGYDRYYLTERIWKRRCLLHKPAHVLNNFLISVDWRKLWRLFSLPLPQNLKLSLIIDKLKRVGDILSVSSQEELYYDIVSQWKNPNQVVLSSCEPPTVFTEFLRWTIPPNFGQRMMFVDMLSYLPDDIMVKVDRASMAVNLESRSPLLDHRLIEFAWSLPSKMKRRDGKGKWILRQVLEKYVPRELFDRPKKGFGIPIGSWLRGQLREWAEELLDPRRLQREGYFNPLPIQQKWNEHISGDRDWQYQLWNVLMFQSWLDHQNA